MPRRSVSFRAAALGGAAALALACRGGTEPESRVLTLEVGPLRVPCIGEGAMLCLQVRSRADQPYTHFYDEIEGFTHEPGYAYVLRVSRRAVPEPPADGSSFAYALVAVVAKTRAAGG
jgi:hypothetical protein